ncbi:hypothetical protein G6011_05168 [Alternaria panax]|uniref:Uncharacterized protein n=1 Tax=Alternaria panax TaxID=48097 RepID=A0AAD4FC46_9PLEO|nr:hypothetical protein G6011_05168 [Alternaria panax]
MTGFIRTLHNSCSLLLVGVILSAYVDVTAAHVVAKRQSQTSGRQRTSLNADWRFERFTSDPDGLSYEGLKPWILPCANDFIIDGEKYERPSTPAPGANISYVSSSFDDTQ